MDKYIVVSNAEAVERKLPGWEGLLHNNDSGFHLCLYETDGNKPTRLVGEDGGEPEDANLARDFRWVVKELNLLATKIMDLMNEIENIHETGG